MMMIKITMQVMLKLNSLTLGFCRTYTQTQQFIHKKQQQERKEITKRQKNKQTKNEIKTARKYRQTDS